jgi:DNA repair exonuclease SbcCD ATPase subunit
MTMQIKEIPRDALELGLRGARLPLTVAEKLLALGDSSWPPALVFDKVEAGVKDIVGRATRDETLQASARLLRAEVTRREEAMTERAHAAEVKQQAEARAEARRDELTAKREAVEDAEAERERQIEQAEREARERADKEAEAKRSATRTTAAKRKQAVSKRARRADAEGLQAESQALRAEQAAVEARGETLDLDKAVQAKKSARRSR